ncbi:hypothetical protein N7466_002815 [Penicillium verhagenii]|uniref:uncharacterized protein n=1 Tax=Penicillium verhagenii TaxID=1562060 RepID=UPI0025451F20|nr:uncharacterized protein N7466_002815 [Penicillium verhagenii]KAJ5939681.1 hypothetical protein N7466_002815 [Penicillium verhagenii]
MAQWTMYLAFDVMGLVGFSVDFRQVEEGTEQAAIKELHQQMLFLGILKPAPWILTILGVIQGLVGDYGQFMTYCADKIAEKKQKWTSNSNQVPEDVISWLMKAIEENDPSAPPGDQALNEDGRLMMIAGSDTTGTTLAHALYFLTKTPSACKNLQQELDKVFGSSAEPSHFTNDKLQKLPYLEAVINETLRLKPAVPSGQPRLTPPEGLQIDEVWIPGETIVVIPQYVIQRDERYFPSGSEFIPERWLGNKVDLIKHEEAFFPFQLGGYIYTLCYPNCIHLLTRASGRYGCVGKQLALMELRAVIARLVYDFDLSFAPGEDGVAFDGESKDTFTFTIGPLYLVFTERRLQ